MFLPFFNMKDKKTNDIIQNFTKEIKELVGSSKLKIIRENEKDTFQFNEGDVVFLSSDLTKEGIVIKYSPENPIISKRVIVRIGQGILIELSPSDLIPKYPLPIENRKRLYVTKKDKYLPLHQLLNEFIVILPKYKISDLMESYDSITKINKYIKVKNIISLENDGFIYVGENKTTKEHFVHIELFYLNGTFNWQLRYFISLETFSVLKKIKYLQLD